MRLPVTSRAQAKSITPQAKLHVYCKQVLGCPQEEASFVYIDDLDNISFSLDKENYLEEDLAHLFNESSIFTVKFQKKNNHSGSKYT